jgi:hypothetical protein
MKLLRDVAVESPLLSLEELSMAADRLLVRIAEERQVVGPGRRTPPRPVQEHGLKERRGLARRIVIGGVTVAAAAAIAVGVLAGAPAHEGRPLPAQLTAREVLDSAAQAALGGPTVAPRPDQFVYTKTVGSSGVVTQTWASVDGSRNGLWIETKNDHQVQSQTLPSCDARVRKGPVLQCVRPLPAYFPDMPASASAMGGYLRQHGGYSAARDLNQLADTVGLWLETHYFLPAQRAALYEFLATTPGLTVERNVQDVTGRPGVSVKWPTGMGTQTEMLVFDPDTYAFLGLTYLDGQARGSGSALDQVAIVSQAGQLP